MLRQRPRHHQTTALHRHLAGDVQERTRRVQADLLGNFVFFMQAQTKLEQARLLLAYQSRQRHGGAHIGQRIVRGVVRQAVGGAQVFQFETHPSLLIGRPDDTLRPQRKSGAHQIEHVPTSALVLPFARVGVEQVAPQQKTREFVVEADRVVTHADGAGLAERLLDGAGKLVLRHAAFQAQLRRNAGNQTRLRIGQIVRRGLAIQHQRIADFVQPGIGANRRELRRAVAARADAEGFVVVPEEGVHAQP